MPLTPPQLDARRFANLVAEARARIPRFTPDWTNFNESDPGMTLVQLQAWLTETLLYQMNRLPELNYIKFLDLLNVTPRPATAAGAELTFTLKKLARVEDPLTVLIPKGAQVAVDDPDLTRDVIFETDYTLTALNAAVGAIITTVQDNPPQRLATRYDDDSKTAVVLHSFYPFGTTPLLGDHCLIGILLRPHRKDDVDYSQDVFPDGELDLTVNAAEVFDEDATGEVIQGPFGEQSLLPFEVTEQAALLEWEVYVGTSHATQFTDTSGDQEAWRHLNLRADDSAGLTDSGHLRLDIPEGVSEVSLHDLPRGFWTTLGLKKPPTALAELLNDLQDVDLDLAGDMIDEDGWTAIGVPAAQLNDVLNCCGTSSELVALLTNIHATDALNPSAISAADWVDLDAGYDAPAVPPFALAWIRVRVVDAAYEPALLTRFLLNTVPATEAVTRLEEVLGNSNGRPAQTFTVKRTPVFYDPQTGAPDLILEIEEGGVTTTWQRVDDFFAQGRDAEVFLLDPTTGGITLGDGVRGRIPGAGALINVKRYRYGGGQDGNAGPGALAKLKSALREVDSVSNLRSASGGSDAESLDNTLLRAPHDLRARDRAVSAEDFALLASQTPGVAIHRAYALARRRLQAPDQPPVEAAGAVTVVVLPINDHPTPQPSEAQIRAVCAHLDPRRLITTELYVTGPRYVEVTRIAAELRVARDGELKAVTDAAVATLLDYFHPLHGGDAGEGWPFGGDIYLGNVYDRLLSVTGVSRALKLELSLRDVSADPACPDLLPIAEGYLIHLPQAVIDLQVVYDNG